MSKPLLTIGIIFRDDIRCIEHCLKALEPLRQAIPCQLVMSDTGSVDGSRAIAERYADVLVDFPWVKDFSAARNSTMDKAEGKWFFTVDTDEYLDEDITELVDFLTGENERYQVCSVMVRNYRNYELKGEYTSFPGVRILRMSTGVRYKGSIHEYWEAEKGKKLHGRVLEHTVLHHDGYVDFNSEVGKRKRKRNMELLRAEVEKKPKDLMRHLQMIESGGGEPDIWNIIQKAAALVDEKVYRWDIVGPAILRHAVVYGQSNNMPDVEEWISKAEKMFPDSLFTRMDVKHVSSLRHWKKEDYAECIAEGEDYLRAVEDFRANAAMVQMVSEIQMGRASSENRIRMLVADAYEKTGGFEKALELLKEVDLTALEPGETSQAFSTLLNVHFKSELDTETVLEVLWERINKPEPSQEKADQRVEAFLKAAAASFSYTNCVNEPKTEGFRRPGWTLFLPMEGRNEAGLWAAMLAETDPDILTEKLATLENWKRLPGHVLAHALNCGVNFPLPGRPLALEEMEALAGRMAEDQEGLRSMVCAAVSGDFAENWQDLAWVRALARAAVRACAWEGPKLRIITAKGSISATDSEAPKKLELAKAFARVEAAFLTRCYTLEALESEHLLVLPSMDRFGWNCAQAFAGLGKGDAGAYMHFVRAAASACPEQKAMAEFLAANMAKPAKPSDQLRVLADQVRATLAGMDPDDPAVAVLKASQAYQAVAHLIEGEAAPVVGGLLQ